MLPILRDLPPPCFHAGVTSSLFDQIAQIQAGETLGPINLSYVDYPRSDGWALNCVIIGQTGPEAAQAAADDPDDADGFILTIPAASTATIPGGRKGFIIEAVKGADVYIAERGSLTVLYNPRVKTPEMLILDAIRAFRAGMATDGQTSLALDGISLRSMTPAEVDSWEAKYIRIVNAQIGRAGGNGGVYAIRIRTPQDNRYAPPWPSYPMPGGRQ